MVIANILKIKLGLVSVAKPMPTGVEIGFAVLVVTLG